MLFRSHDKKALSRDRMDPASWVEKYNTAHPYTEQESNMIQGALKTIGSDSDHIIADHRSLEHPDTHKISPVTGFKGYKHK